MSERMFSEVVAHFLKKKKKKNKKKTERTNEKAAKETRGLNLLKKTQPSHLVQIQTKLCFCPHDELMRR